MSILNRIEGDTADAYGYRNCVGDDCIAWEREEHGDEEGFCRAFPTFLRYTESEVITRDPEKELLDVIERNKDTIKRLLSD
jgi:hypothetical protein